MDADCIKLSELKALVIRPGEVLVLQAHDRRLSDDLIKTINECAKAAGVKVLLMDSGLTIAGVQRAEGGDVRISNTAPEEVAADIASGCGPVSRALKSRGVNLSGNIPRR